MFDKRESYGLSMRMGRSFFSWQTTCCFQVLTKLNIVITLFIISRLAESRESSNFAPEINNNEVKMEVKWEVKQEVKEDKSFGGLNMYRPL